MPIIDRNRADNQDNTVVSIGNNSNSILSIVDLNENLKVSQMTRVFGDVFVGSSIDTERWDSSGTINSATVNLVSGCVQLSSGTNTAGSAVMRSVPVSYSPSGITSYFQAEIRLGDTGAASSRRRWGAFDSNDGYFFELNGTTLNIVSRKATVDTTVASGSWTGTVPTLDTNSHRYQIYWTSVYALFLIDRVVAHTLNITTTTLVLTPHLKLSFETTNIGSSVTRLLEVRNPLIGRIGIPNSESLSHYCSTNETRTLKIGPGKLHRMIIGDKGTLSGLLVVYDNTAGSGKILLSLDLTQVVPDGVGASLDIPFYLGLTYVTSGGNQRITFLWD